METTKVLECGCVIEEINGKHITIMCEDCEENYQDTTFKFPKKTKMRLDREI